MTKFCPVCTGEFNDDVSICPTDKKVLIKNLPPSLELVDIYAASNIMEAELIISLFMDQGILANEITEGISQLPVASDTRFIISVVEDSLLEAREILNQARADGAISKNGSFL